LVEARNSDCSADETVSRVEKKRFETPYSLLLHRRLLLFVGFVDQLGDLGVRIDGLHEDDLAAV